MNTASDIEREAADWVIKIGDPNCTPEQLSALDDWLAQSAEHKRLFHELRKIWHAVDLPDTTPVEQPVDVATACRGVIRAYHKRYAENPEEVERLVRDTYQRLVAPVDPSLGHTRSVREFLLATARDIALERLRKLSVVPMDYVTDIETLHRLDVDQEIAVIVETDLILSALWAEYKKLPRRYRDVVELRAMRGYSVQEISARLGINEGEVKERLAMALCYLQQAASRVKEGDASQP